MKKFFALSLVAMLFGCNNNTISDELAHSFEDNLNKEIQILSSGVKNLVKLGTGADINIKTDGYKCENKKTYLDCKNDAIKVELIDPDNALTKDVSIDILNIKDLHLKTNALYLGDKKGKISLKEAFENMPKNIQTSTTIGSIKLGDPLVAMLAFAALTQPKLSELTTIANDEFSISSNTNTKEITQNGKLTSNIHIIGKNNKNELSIELDIGILEQIFQELDKAGFMYDTQNPNLFLQDELLANQVKNIEQFLFLNKLNSYIKINTDLSKLKLFYSSEIANIPEPFKNIINSFFDKHPHEIKQTLIIKDGLKFKEILKNKAISNEEKKENLKNIEFKINDIDLGQTLLKNDFKL